jgi:hypothetical protein
MLDYPLNGNLESEKKKITPGLRYQQILSLLKLLCLSSWFINKMLFDPENPVIKLCAEGMRLEGEGKPAKASALFIRHLLWDEFNEHPALDKGI